MRINGERLWSSLMALAAIGGFAPGLNMAVLRSLAIAVAQFTAGARCCAATRLPAE